MDRINVWALATALAVSITFIPVLSTPTQAASKKGVQHSSYQKTKPYKKSRYKTRFSKPHKKRARARLRTGGGCQNLSRSVLRDKAENFSGSIASASRKYGVSPNLIGAVITIESCFNSRALGAAGEKGLMQLMPATARRFNVTNGYNVWQNVHGGTKYLGYLLDRYDGRTPRAVAAYNAGEGNVKHAGPIRNQAYVNKVMTAYNKFTVSGFASSIRGGVLLAKDDIVPRKPTKVVQSAKNTVLAELSPRTKRTQRVSRLVRQPSLALQARANTVLPWADIEDSAGKKVQGSQRTFRGAAKRTHTVREGDTAYSIARAYGLSMQQLTQLNNLRDPHAVMYGRVLRLR